jgi:release factor glutamine methyltransferase
VTIQHLADAARRRLLDAGLPGASAAFDAEYLAREALGWDRARFLAELASPAPPGFAERYEAWVRRRAGREPASYIVGHREFWGREFDVTPAVLVPRPETELIVEEALSFLVPAGAAGPRHPAGAPPVLLADVGTGSGCLAISLACESPSARVVATDTSFEALAVAARNARRHGVADRVAFVQTDVLAGLASPVESRGAPGLFDLVVSNPPYVPARHLASLQPEVRKHEPIQALAGGDDGLAVVRRLLPEVASRLKPGGRLIFEFGDGQVAEVERLVVSQPDVTLLRIRDDLQGIARTAVVEKR